MLLVLRQYTVEPNFFHSRNAQWDSWESKSWVSKDTLGRGLVARSVEI